MIKIALTKGYFAIVDQEDLDLLSGYSGSLWDSNSKRISTAGLYAHAKVPVTNRTIKLHRLILNAKPGTIVDHINGDGLDNRRENLRLVTASENGANRRKGNLVHTSKHKGVHRRENGKWRASIRTDKKLINIGTYATEKEAAEEYNFWALFIYGDCAKINII